MPESLNRQSLTDFEAEKANFHQRVFDGYISLARRNKERIKIIDALKTEEDIHNEILKHIESFMKKIEVFNVIGFNQILGHENIIHSLKNSIMGERVNHAYIFSGEKGIGKHTLAKAFAKTP